MLRQMIASWSSNRTEYTVPSRDTPVQYGRTGLLVVQQVDSGGMEHTMKLASISSWTRAPHSTSGASPSCMYSGFMLALPDSQSVAVSVTDTTASSEALRCSQYSVVGVIDVYRRGWLQQSVELVLEVAIIHFANGPSGRSFCVGHPQIPARIRY